MTGLVAGVGVLVAVAGLLLAGMGYGVVGVLVVLIGAGLVYGSHRA